MSITAMKQALEALERSMESGMTGLIVDKSITSLRQAISEAEKQCKYPNCDYPCMNLPDCKDGIKWSDYESDGRIIKNYPEKDKT